MNNASVYVKLPRPLQNLACSLEGWRIQRTRYTPSFWTLLREAEERSSWPPDQVRQYRDQRLRRFVQYCSQSVPYYQRWFRENDVAPQDIRTLDDLTRLPILTKTVVQDHCSSLTSDTVPVRQRITTHTSGTTGAGLRFSTTLAALQQQYAIEWRYFRSHGIRSTDWCAYFGGRSVVPISQVRTPFWRYNHPGRQLLFSAYHMSPRNMIAYIGELRRKKPPWLHGYPSLLALLAAHILDTRTDLGYEIRWITVSSENLLLQQANLIKRAFGVRPLQHYGMTEAVANMSECEYGKLHVDEDFSAVQFVPRKARAGYSVVGANLSNPATPLLRYDVQDIVVPSQDGCHCGRPGRTVDTIDGRREDYVVLRNGARLGRMDHIFKDMVHIREAQIYQKVPGAIVVRIVRSECFADSNEEMLLNEVRQRVGVDTEITIAYVNELERSSRGKLRFVISEVPEAQLV